MFAQVVEPVVRTFQPLKYSYSLKRMDPKIMCLCVALDHV